MIRSTYIYTVFGTKYEQTPTFFYGSDLSPEIPLPSSALIRNMLKHFHRYSSILFWLYGMKMKFHVRASFLVPRRRGLALRRCMCFMFTWCFGLLFPPVIHCGTVWLFLYVSLCWLRYRLSTTRTYIICWCFWFWRSREYVLCEFYMVMMN